MSLSKKITSAMFWDFLGLSIIAVMGLATSVMLVRLLGEEVYGILAYVLTLKWFVVMLSSLGIETTLAKFVPQFKVRNELHKIKFLLSKIVKLRLLIWLVVSLTMFLGSHNIAQYIIGKPALEIYVKVIPLLLLPSFFTGIFVTLLVTYFTQRYINVIRIMNSILTLLGATVAIVLGYDLIVVLSVYFLAECIQLILAYLKVRNLIKHGDEAKGETVFDWKRIKSYSINIYIYSIMIFVLGKGLDILMIGRLSDDLSQVAFYSIAFSLVYFSISLMDRAFAGGFDIPLVSELYTKNDRRNLDNVFKGLFEVIYLYVIPVSIGGLLLSANIIDLLYGEKFVKDVSYAASLFFIFAAMAKYGGITATFLTAMDKEKALIHSRILFGITNIILNFFLIQKYGALGAIIGTGIAGILGACYEGYVVHNLLHPKYPIGFIVKVLASSIVMGITVLALKTILMGMSNTVITISCVGVGALVYISSIIVLKPVSKGNVDLIRKMNLPWKNKVVWALS